MACDKLGKGQAAKWKIGQKAEVQIRQGKGNEVVLGRR